MTVSAEGASGAVVLAISDGASAAVSNPSEARFRYNPALNRIEVSENGGAWVPLGTGGLATGVFSSNYTCPSGLAVGEAAALTAADTVDKADASPGGPRPAVGFVASKPTSTSCVLQYFGEQGGFAGLTAGATYWLSETAGQITATAPQTAGAAVQVVGWARSATTLVIDLEQDYALRAT